MTDTSIGFILRSPGGMPKGATENGLYEAPEAFVR